MTNSNEVFSCVVIDVQLAELGCHTQDQHSVWYQYNGSMSSNESGEGVKIRKSLEASYA